MTVTEPVVGSVLGVVVLGETLRPGDAGLAHPDRRVRGDGGRDRGAGPRRGGHRAGRGCQRGDAPRCWLAWWRAERHRDHPVGAGHGARTRRRGRGGAAPTCARRCSAAAASCRTAGSPRRRRRRRGRRRRVGRHVRAATASTSASRSVPRRTAVIRAPTAAVRADHRLGARAGQPAGRAEVRVYAADHDAAGRSGDRPGAARRDRRARPSPVGVLVVADGANTLTPPAPGGYDPDSVPVQAALDDALAAGDAAALTAPARRRRRAGRLPGAGRAVRPGAAVGRELYRGAPYGVGYFVSSASGTRRCIERRRGPSRSSGRPAPASPHWRWPSPSS